MKKIFILLPVIVILLFTVVSADDYDNIGCSAIIFEDGSGNVVTDLQTQETTAKVTVTNNGSEPINPALVVCSFENGKMNGIWYKTADAELASGESAQISVSFTPETIENTVINATLVDSMLNLNAPVASAQMLNNSTGLESIYINGSRFADYSDYEDNYLYMLEGKEVTAKANVADGGTSQTVKLPDSIPGVAEVSLTAPDGTQRNLSITLYNKEDQLYSLTGLSYEIDGTSYEIEGFDPDVTSYVVSLPDNTLYATVKPKKLSVSESAVTITDRNLYAEGGKLDDETPSYFLTGPTTKGYVHRGTREAYENIIPIKNEKTTATVKVSYGENSKEYKIDFTARQPRLTYFALGDGNFTEFEKPYFVSGAAANNDNGTAVGADRNTWTLGGMPKDLIGASMISLYSVNGMRDTASWQRTAGNENTLWCEFRADTPGTIYIVGDSITSDFYVNGTDGWENATNYTGCANKLLKADIINTKIYENLPGVYCYYAFQWNPVDASYKAEQITKATASSGDVTRHSATYKKTFDVGETVRIFHTKKIPAAVYAEAFIVWDTSKD